MPSGSETATPVRRAESPRARAIAERLRDGVPARIAGAGTKLGWGRPADGVEALHVDGLDRIVAHERGDFTAIVEAGVRLADLQAELATAGQMLALDPPGDDATVGGIFATADSGPLRHRYGAPRDLIIGVTLALADGTVAQAGGRVIKNVAGYDLAKLATGSFGTLGVIVEVCLRLHPRPDRTATAMLEFSDPHALAEEALRLSSLPLEAEAIDLRWSGDAGALLVQFAGVAATDRAAAISTNVTKGSDPFLREVEGSRTKVTKGSDPFLREVEGSRTKVTKGSDPFGREVEGLWEAQRAGQRSADGVVVRVHGLPGDLARVLACAREHGASVVGRAAVGTSWLTLPPDADIAAIRAALAPRPCVVTDAPADVRARVDPWDVPEGPELDLMRRVKERFDPERKCNPGIFVGGI